MRLEIRAIGRIKAGPERVLIDDYLERAGVQGRNLGLGPASEREIDPRTLKTRAAETGALMSDIEPGAAIMVLDETGAALSSAEMAQWIKTARDDGVRQAVFLIGGAEGHAREALPTGARRVSFGKATWPHRLVRVMLAEQIYRAVSIIAGTPYHREG